MAIVHLGDMLQHAFRNGYAVGGFHLFSLDSLSAVIAAAEDCRAPVILNVAQRDAQLFDIETLLAAAEHAAERASVPIALHFDHSSGVEAATQGIRWGCNGVTVDASPQALPENIDRTRAVVEMARGCGVPVEGIVGCIAADPNADTQETASRSVLISAEEAKAYVERTGVDFLAVSIGGSRGRCSGKQRLDMQRIGRIKAAVDVPLVVHGGGSLGDEQTRRLVVMGVAKINYDAALLDAAKARISRTLQEGEKSGMATTPYGTREAIKERVQLQLRLLGSAGRAAEVLLRCRAWQPVEHVIIFNVAANTSMDIAHVLAVGQRVLNEIPGVRRVFAGNAVQAGAAYRFCWLVRFVHRAVIESYRDHPVHKKFADELFRPLAPERISIDFEINGPRDDTGFHGDRGDERSAWAPASEASIALKSSRSL